MRMHKKFFENLLDSVQARQAFEWPQPSHCQIVRGCITVYYNKKYAAIRPLEDPDFFLSFARLGNRGRPSDSRIRTWVSNHGLPKREERDTWGEGPAKSDMLVETFRREVQDAYELLTLYTEIKGHNLPALRARVAEPKTAVDKKLVAVRRPHDLLYLEEMVVAGALGNGDPELFMGMRALSEVLAEMMSGVRLKLDIVSPSSAVHSYHCTDLAAALYLQFYLLVAEQRQMRLCGDPACGTPFVATRKDKRFCNNSCRSHARIYRT